MSTKKDVDKKWININFFDENESLNKPDIGVKENLSNQLNSTMNSTPVKPIIKKTIPKKKINNFDWEKINADENKIKFDNDIKNFQIQNQKIENEIKWKNINNWYKKLNKTKKSETIKNPTIEMEGSMHEHKLKNDVEKMKNEIKQNWNNDMWLRIKRWIIDKLAQNMREKNNRFSFIQFLLDNNNISELNHLTEEEIASRVIDKLIYNRSISRLTIINAYWMGDWNLILITIGFSVLFFLYLTSRSGYRVWNPYTTKPIDWGKIEANQYYLSKLIIGGFKAINNLKPIPKMLRLNQIPVFRLELIMNQKIYYKYLHYMRNKRWKRHWK